MVIALDGFDIRYCPKRFVDKITQREYGFYDVGMLEKTFTPICFSAILTGKDPRSFGYSGDFISNKYGKGFQNWLRPLFWIRRNIFGFVKSFGIHKRMIKNELLDTKTIDRNMNEAMKKNTIINRLTEENFSVYSPNVPSYSEKMKDIDHIASLIGKPLFHRMNFIDDLYDKIVFNWYQMLDNLPDNDLIFFYSKLPDEAHHLLSHILEYNKIIEYIYDKLCNLPMLFDLKDVAILILSDHGFSHRFTDLGKDIHGTHSNTGFWSTNVDTNIRPRVVFDFYDLIYELVVYH